MLRVGVIGASGYTGAELVRLLSGHPRARVVAATSESYAGQSLAEVFPALGEAGRIPLTRAGQTSFSPDTLDLVCLALPHGEAMQRVPALLSAGLRVIDFSGDFRFPDPGAYPEWYGFEHTAPDLLTQAVYGLPELFRQKIRGAAFIANPGCFVTSAVLALYPALKAGRIESRGLVVDAKSGSSGAGRKPSLETMFNRLAENVVPYKLAGTHQHTPEIEQVLKQATGHETVITFSPQLVPAKRGILSLAYGRLTGKTTTAEMVRLYRDTYAGEPFVQVREEHEPWPDLASAVATNTCLVKVAVDARSGLLVAAGALDNLVKGAAGQAIQNLNASQGWDETLGLPRVGLVS